MAHLMKVQIVLQNSFSISIYRSRYEWFCVKLFRLPWVTLGLRQKEVRRANIQNSICLLDLYIRDPDEIKSKSVLNTHLRLFSRCYFTEFCTRNDMEKRINIIFVACKHFNCILENLSTIKISFDVRCRMFSANNWTSTKKNLKAHTFELKFF